MTIEDKDLNELMDMSKFELIILISMLKEQIKNEEGMVRKLKGKCLFTDVYQEEHSVLFDELKESVEPRCLDT